jgi:bifunctional pyridoxal-dependent enzyme with beta-cystathionase and maltose regulon repressor activities
MFRIVLWDVLPCKIIVDNYFTRQYIAELNFILAAVRTWNLTGLNVAHFLSYFKELMRYFLQGLKEQEKDLTVALGRDLKRILSKYESDV